ncbi:unnamed protein product, partial [Staurois parvus]
SAHSSPACQSLVHSTLLFFYCPSFLLPFSTFFHFNSCRLLLTVEYLVRRKFHRWTYCTGGNLSRYHT